MTNALLIYQKPKNAEELRSCAVFQRELFELLVKENSLMWDEILFPCADSRSVTVAKSLNEPSVFGTHAIISAVDEKPLKSAAKTAADLTKCEVSFKIKVLENTPDAVEKALKTSFTGFQNEFICGDFSSLVSGNDENWKIRDTARKFLSFAETANDKTGKSFIGLLGGKAVFEKKEDSADKILKIYEQKTGTKAKIHKTRGSAK